MIYERFGEEVERILKNLLRTADIQISSVTHRLKELHSFRQKIESSDKYVLAASVTDFVGARVITYFADDVDRVVDVIGDERNFEIDAQNTVDKRRELRADQFGYQSLHLVAALSRGRIFFENREFAGLKIEIQIRSILQHTWAEIEHDYYKAERGLPLPIKRRIYVVAGLLETADNEFSVVRRAANEFTMELPVCRGEGVTELVPDFSIGFPHSAVPAGLDPSTSLLSLYVNTNITNRIIGLDEAALKARETEVEMYVEQGGSDSTNSGACWQS